MSGQKVNLTTSTLEQVLEQTGWLRRDAAREVRHRNDRAIGPRLDADSCLLSVMADMPHTNATGKLRLRRLIESGWTLRSEFAHSSTRICSPGIGPFFFGHARYFSPARKYACLASSRLGRNIAALPDWGRWLDDLVRRSIASRLSILVVEHTAAANAFWLPIKATGLDALRLTTEDSVEPSPGNTIQWIADQLLSGIGAQDVVRVSPFAADSRRRCPARDILSVLLGDVVFVPYLRPGGAIESLLHQRIALNDDEACHTSEEHTFVPQKAVSRRGQAILDGLIDRGATAWLVGEDAASDNRRTQSKQSYSDSGPLIRCCKPPPCLVQLIAPIRASRLVTSDEPEFLAHCTRALGKHHPFESNSARSIRLWAEGPVVDSPMATLCRILDSGKLYGSSQWNRTPTKLVSFSAVPLDELLSRRKFRSHLGRWDWLPYGVRIQTRSLVALGARPVIYGDEATYDALDAGDRPYFQLEESKPRKSGRGVSNATNWQEELEWRFAGDLAFSRLPREAVQVFVAFKREALAIAQVYPWSVFWYSDSDD